MDSLLIEPCFLWFVPPVYARSLLCFFALAAPRMSAYTMPDLLGKAFFQNQSKGGQAISCRTQPPSNSRERIGAGTFTTGTLRSLRRFECPWHLEWPC
ncbi:hypothetical protein BKA82DRAFT_4234214 [Pisolithus tinctorius]|nr:hypothetical protein BKA82DRAFT_4234214 [Pisolithus tinctorius]